MKRHLKKIVVVLLIIATSLTFAAQTPVPTEAVSQSDIEAAKKEQEKIQQQRKEYEGKLNTLKTEMQSVENYIKELDELINGINTKISDLENQMNEKAALIEETEIKLEAAKVDEAEQYEAMKLRIQYMYEHGSASYLDVLFKAENFSDLLNKAEYLSKITEYDRNMLEKLSNTKNEIAATEAKLKAEYAIMEDLQSQNRIELASAEYVHATKNSEIERLTAMVNDSESELANIIKQEDVLEDNIEKMVREWERQVAEAEKQAALEKLNQGGFFHWPLPGYYRVSSPFNPNRLHPVLGYVRPHNGTDLPAPTGVPIVAAAAGKVVISQYSVSAGNYIMIDHGGGVYTEYMHCSKLLVKVGETVKQDQKIALVGSTGYSTGAHLHFGIRVNGTYIDPMKQFNFN